VRPGRLVPVLAAAVATLAAGCVPFFVSIAAWPEIVTPAWFVAQGWPLYERIFFPHTPLLILVTALGGRLFGFGAPLLRALVAIPMAAAAALVVLGSRPGRSSGVFSGLLVGVPLVILWTVYTEGPALWPEPFLAPAFLGAALLLERFERSGHRRMLAGGALLLGASVLVKQTSAWAGIAALAWLLLRSRRRSVETVGLFAAGLAVPFGLFAVGWGLARRTAAHLTWTLIVPLFTPLASEIAAPPGPADFHEAFVLFLAIPALALADCALAGRRARSPAGWIALGCLGMAWPRWGLLHLAGAVGLAALLSSRAVVILAVAARRFGRKGLSSGRRLALAGGAAALLVAGAVAVAGAGPLLLSMIGGPVFHWDDSSTARFAEAVRKRLPPGHELLVFDAPQNIYPLTRTLAPGRLYVNPSFWYCLDKDGVDARLVSALDARPGLLVLFHEPLSSASRLRETALWRFLASRTRTLERLDGTTSFRVVEPRAH
jgi:hypothetical protein